MIGTLDSQVIEKFKEFQKKTGKYADLDIEEVELKESFPFNDDENVVLMGSKNIASHEELANINDKNGLPVYDASSNINTYVDENKFPSQVFKVENNDNPDISFASEGNSSAGTNFIIHQNKYFVNNHRTVIKFSNKYYSKYVYYNIFKMKEKYSFKRGYTPSQKELKRLEIMIPLPRDYNEKYKSFAIQKAIVDFLEFWKSNYTDIFRKTVSHQKPIIEKIQKALIPATLKHDKTIENSFNAYSKSKGMMIKLSQINFEEKQVTQIVDITRGKVISKKDLKIDGKYPVYSSQTKKDGLFGFINDYMFDGDAITWTTDGKHAGTTFLRSGKFNYTNVCGLMTIKEGVAVDIHYLSYMTKLIFPKYVDRTSQNSKLMTHHLDAISIPIPSSSNINTKNLQILVMEFWKNIFTNIDNQFVKFENIIRLTDKIDKAFLYRTFSKINWGK